MSSEQTAFSALLLPGLTYATRNNLFTPVRVFLSFHHLLPLTADSIVPLRLALREVGVRKRPPA
jgi:hypothetical protein